MSESEQAKNVGDPDFVYVVYIAAPIEKVWAALTDSETARAWWWNTRHESTYEPGAPIRYLREDGVDVEGKILEVQPPTRLVHTFQSAGPGPMHDEGATNVVYDLSTDGKTTRLMVTHSGFIENSQLRNGISNGWPLILSSLKSILEGGEAIAFDPEKGAA